MENTPLYYNDDTAMNPSFVKAFNSTLFETKETKHKHEFQELCEELEPIYGKLIWTLPHKVGFTEFKIRKAHEIAQKRGVTSIKYLIGIIKKL